LFQEGYVLNENGSTPFKVKLCQSCNDFLKQKRTPKFSQINGLIFGDIPNELKILGKLFFLFEEMDNGPVQVM